MGLSGEGQWFVKSKVLREGLHSALGGRLRRNLCTGRKIYFHTDSYRPGGGEEV